VYAKLKKSISPMNLFLIISGFGILGFFIIVVPKYGEEAFRWLVMEHNYNFQFGDYYRPVMVAENLETVYTNKINIPYPPLAFLIFHWLWKIGAKNADFSWTEWQKYEAYQYNLLLLFMLMLITIVLMTMVAKKILSNYTDLQSGAFLVFILCSAPFYQGVIERGNIVLMALALLLFAVLYRNSENKVVREFSLIFIALAAGLKIYPAVFGLLYLKDKRWAESVRLIMYGMIFFFLPFLFTGGIPGILGFFARMKKLSGNYTVGLWTSIRCFMASAYDYLNLNWNIQFVSKALEIFFALVSIMMFFIEKREWKSILYLCGIMTLCTPRSFRYNSIFMIIPILLLFAENKKNVCGRKIDLLYSALFASSFTIPIWLFHREVDFGIFFPIYLILLIGFFETIYAFLTNNKKGIAMKRKDFKVWKS